jgi:hypothetical protein
MKNNPLKGVSVEIAPKGQAQEIIDWIIWGGEKPRSKIINLEENNGRKTN